MRTTQYKNYLIDCLGYSEDDLKDLDIDELEVLIDDVQDFEDYTY